MEKKYKIHEVAEKLGVSPSLIRYYGNRGLVEIDQDPENGYRLFSDADIFKIWLVLFHRSIHMGLGEINFLMRGTSVEETHASVEEHRKKLLDIMAQAKRDLEICDFYDRYIDRAARDGDTPVVLENLHFYLYELKDIFRREKPSFPACTFGCIYENGEKRQYSMVYEVDMQMLSPEERGEAIGEMTLSDILSVVVSVDGASSADDALKKALAIAEALGYAVAEPYYALFLLSVNEQDSLGYCYEVLLSLQKGY